MLILTTHDHRKFLINQNRRECNANTFKCYLLAEYMYVVRFLQGFLVIHVKLPLSTPTNLLLKPEMQAV